MAELQNKPLPSLEALVDKARKDPGCPDFVNKLQEKKNRLLHFYTLLEFKTELREQKHILLSARLEGINKSLDYLKPLEESWPDGRGRRRIKYLIAFNSYKQMKLSEELKKWDVPELLKTELQMNCIKNQVGLTDELISALTNTMERPIPYCISSEIAA